MIHNKLNQLLKTHKISAYELSKRTGIDQGLISHYRKGTKTPRQAGLNKIAKEFGVRIGELFD